RPAGAEPQPAVRREPGRKRPRRRAARSVGTGRSFRGARSVAVPRQPGLARRQPDHARRHPPGGCLAELARPPGRSMAMSGALAAYLRRRVAVCTLTLAALIVALMQVLELMDITTDVLDRGLGFEGLAYYALLRVPSEIVLALPLAALLGAMWAFHDL